jgi:uncharacterized repeat protein (TIGR03803 family)
MMAPRMSRRATARRQTSYGPRLEALEDRLVLATLAGFSSLASVYSVGAPVVSDQGVGYVAYTVPSGTPNITAAIAQISPDGSINPTFATFPSYSAGAPYLGVPYPQLVGDPSASNFELYGTTINGGANDDGSVFSVSASGAITIIASFDNTNDGYGPDSLLLSDGVLYGTTDQGGKNGDGVIFSVPVGGGTPKVVGTFNGTNGSGSNPGLALSNGVLYGTTQIGGTYSSGTVFSVPVGGGDITTLANFSGGTIANGSVLVEDGYVMGTTAQDSDASGNGSLFRISTTPGGQLYSVPITGSSDIGSNPFGGLIDDNGAIIGATSTGGSDGTGSLFRVNLPSFTISYVADFPHHGTAGILPHDSFTSDDHGNVYGVAHGYEGDATSQAIFWKLSDVTGGGGGGGGTTPENLTAPKLSRPGKSSILQTTTPRFKWTRVKGATSYELLITDITPGIQAALSHPVDEMVYTGTAFTLPSSYTLNPGHYYYAQVRAIGSDPNQPGPWSNEVKFKIAEQKTDSYRIRLDFAGGISLEAAGGVYAFTIQALDDSEDRPALGPPRVMIFGGAGGSFPSPLEGSFTTTSEWVDFRTPRKILVDDLDGAGGITSYPSITTPFSFDGVLGDLTTTRLIVVFRIKGRKFQDNLSFSDTNGIGIDTGTILAGKWKVLKAPRYDPTLWPNKIVPN